VRGVLARFNRGFLVVAGEVSGGIMLSPIMSTSPFRSCGEGGLEVGAMPAL
jgi:hypothetical protein